MPDTGADLRGLGERLTPIGVEGVRPLRGGASSLTYVATIGGDGGRRAVVKVAPAGLPPVRNRDVLRQARLLRRLEPTAVPVPEVLWEDAGDPPEVPPLFVMSFVEGTSLEPLFDRDGDEDEELVAARMRDAASTMAALHALKPDSLALGNEPVIGPIEEVERWGRLLQTVDPELAPGWEAVAAALGAHVPSAVPGSVVHGDFRLGNTLATGSRIAAVVDWEIWSVGDPRVDVGWFLANADPDTYRRSTRYAGTLPTPSALADLYAGSGGREVTDLEWFLALVSFKSAATWSAIVKHNRRRGSPEPEIEEMAGVVPHLLTRAKDLIR